VGRTLDVVYEGSTQRSRASVSDSISVDTYYSGEEIFGSRGRGPTMLLGKTGARTGTGTDTMVGRATLNVSHDTTSYSGTSGVQPGTSSAAEDTVIGASGAYKLTIEDTSGDGSSGTIRLGSGDPVAFTNGMTNLKVTGVAGHVVYVDTTNISPGFSGTVDIESTGRLSIDGGESSVAIDFSSNQVVEDSLTGKAVTIDSSQILRTGADNLEFPGTSDAFQVLYELASDLRNQRNLNTMEMAESLDRRLGELENISKNAYESLGAQASSLRTLESLGHRVDDLKLAIEIESSQIQATDLPSTILQMENSQTLLQYTYAVMGELSQLGLLQFLR
jgi:flagellin-like hook-associated protein FlgL